MTMLENRRARVWLAIGVCAVAAWWILSAFVGPALIRAGYEERSLALVNRVFGGRDLHPLQDYLDAWAGLVRRVWLLIVAIGVGTPLLIAIRRSLATRAPALWAAPALGPGGAFVLGVWLGLAIGLFEAAGVRISEEIQSQWSFWPNPHAFWMVPFVTAAVLGGGGAALALLIGGLRRPVSLRILVVPLVTVGLYGAVRAFRTGLHELAILVLALGVAVSLARLLAAHGTGFVKLVRRTTVPAGAALALTAATLGLLRSSAERRALAQLADSDADSILLIVLDTVRASSLGLYGYPRPTTPTLERLAEEAVVFDSAYATSSWTLPSHVGLFTGRSHHELEADFRQQMSDRYPTLAEVLAEAGYATAGFVANRHYTGRRSGIDRGFAHYEDFPLTIPTAFRTGWLANRVFQRIPFLRLRDPVARKLSEDVNDEFLGWLPAADGHPFFVFLNYYEAHAPYPLFQQPLDTFGPERPPLPPTEMGAQAGERIDRYDSSIGHMDAQIERLLRTLAEHGRLDNTIVVVTSDHGELFGEHDLTGHGNSLYAPTVHVPLLIWRPGRTPSVRIGTPVSNRDIAATLLDLVGVEPRSALAGRSLVGMWQGRSTADGVDAATAGPTAADGPLVRETSVAAAPEWPAGEPVLMEVNPNPNEPNPDFPSARGPMKALVWGGYQYILNGDGVEELYLLAADPWQLDDLADSEPEILERFRAELRLRGLLAGSVTP